MTIEKKQETNGITKSCFFVWQFMVHSMICMSGQPGLTLAFLLAFGFHVLFKAEAYCLLQVLCFFLLDKTSFISNQCIAMSHKVSSKDSRVFKQPNPVDHPGMTQGILSETGMGYIGKQGWLSTDPGMHPWGLISYPWVQPRDGSKLSLGPALGP